MNALTATATAVHTALAEAPASAAELRQRLRRGRATIDKALAELAEHGLATPIAAGGPDDETWVLVDNPATADTAATAGTDSEPTVDEPVADEEAATPEAGASATAEGDTDGVAAEEVKLCRGCQAQMPMLCPTCWGKTSSYCGNCKRQMPARGSGGSPGILSSGLPKLTHGELIRLVEDVMRTQPLPNHLGITGWTSSRIAVFLPGRSTGAIGNALERLSANGTTERLADNPKRYRLLVTGDDDTSVGEAEKSRAEAIGDTDASST